MDSGQRRPVFYNPRNCRNGFEALWRLLQQPQDTQRFGSETERGVELGQVHGLFAVKFVKLFVQPRAES